MGKAKTAKQLWTEAQTKIIPGYGWEQASKDEAILKEYEDKEKEDKERFDKEWKTYQRSESTLVLMIVREA